MLYRFDTASREVDALQAADAAGLGVKEGHEEALAGCKGVGVTWKSYSCRLFRPMRVARASRPAVDR